MATRKEIVMLTPQIVQLLSIIVENAIRKVTFLDLSIAKLGGKYVKKIPLKTEDQIVRKHSK